MRIPMRGAIGSLNAAVAGSVLLYEAVAQRDPDGRRSAPSDTIAAPPEAPSVAPVRPTEIIGDDIGDDTEGGPDENDPDAPAQDLLPGGPAVDEPAPPPKPSRPRKPRTPHA
jgi:hypothetical protein